jgi:hypothetical protein
MTRLRITIDEVFLTGLDRPEGRALVEGLKSELQRLFSDPAIHAQLEHPRRIPTLRLGSAPLAAGSAGAAKFGRNMAHAIGRGLKR